MKEQENNREAKRTYAAGALGEVRSLLVVGPEELVSEVLSVVLEQDVGFVRFRDEFAPQEHFLDEFVDVGVLLGAWERRAMKSY